MQDQPQAGPPSVTHLAVQCMQVQRETPAHLMSPEQSHIPGLQAAPTPSVAEPRPAVMPPVAVLTPALSRSASSISLTNGAVPASAAELLSDAGAVQASGNNADASNDLQAGPQRSTLRIENVQAQPQVSSARDASLQMPRAEADVHLSSTDQLLADSGMQVHPAAAVDAMHAVPQPEGTTLAQPEPRPVRPQAPAQAPQNPFDADTQPAPRLSVPTGLQPLSPASAQVPQLAPAPPAQSADSSALQRPFRSRGIVIETEPSRSSSPSPRGSGPASPSRVGSPRLGSLHLGSNAVSSGALAWMNAAEDRAARARAAMEARASCDSLVGYQLSKL